jgi:hypothetical protein
MKRILLLTAFLITSGIFLTIQAQPDKAPVKEIKTDRPIAKKGEKIFSRIAGKCLIRMEQVALKNSVSGAAIIAFIPGEATASWVSKMKVVGTMCTGKSNLLAVASSKAAEMAATLTDSGSGIRKPLTGELGWKGGMIRKVKHGYIVAAFSGGPSEIDLQISKEGLDTLVKYY